MKAVPLISRHVPRILLAVGIAATTALTVQSPAVGAARDHCVGVAGTVAAPPPVAPVCFETFAEAIAYVTRGAVQLPAAAATVTQEQLDTGYAARRAAKLPELAEVVIGISYMDPGFVGASFVHSAESGCDGDSGVEWRFQFPSGWNDKVSSARSYQQCTGRYWENGSGSSGSGVSATTDWSGGSINDRATFVEWF